MSISGLVDIGYQNVNASDNTKDRSNIAQNGSATTTLNVAGTEDLGGGLKGNFRVEFNPDLVNGTGVMAATGGMHQTFLGLAGNFGEVKMGRVNTPALSAWLTGSVFGTALGSGYSAGQNIFSPAGAGTAPAQVFPTRYNGSIEYTTPSFNGLTARLYAVPKNDGSTDGTKNNAGVTDLGLAYNNGPLNVALSSQSLSAGTSTVLSSTALQYNASTNGGLVGQDQNGTTEKNSKLVQNTLAANYNFGAATVYGALWTTKESYDLNTVGTTTAKRSGAMIGAKYAVSSAVDLMASYAKADDKLLTADAKLFGLGVDYKLSKRTALYARYADLNANKSITTQASKTTAIGVRHAF